MKVEQLIWDTDFFNKKIGKLNIDDFNRDNFIEFLELSKKENYQLLYVFGDENLIFGNEILNKFNGVLIDRKVLYTKNLVDVELTESIATEFTELEMSEDLELLSYTSGAHSRFKIDKGFDSDDFYRLYKIWMKKSVEREIADKVFVVKEDEQILGVVTLQINNDIGHIGLIAVSDKAQGKGYGKNLINICENELISRGIYKIEVPTQIANSAGCKFYEKCGFTVCRINNIFHFWL